MNTRLGLTLVAIAVAATAIISFSTFNSDPESIIMTDFGPSDSLFVNTAHAGAALNSAEVAKIMRVRIVQTGHNDELVFGSFSRIGFVSGTGSQFLLESLPSLDKKPFYKLVQKSMNSQKNMLANPTYLDVNIDLFAGNYELIQTLSYDKCLITEYFIHAVDSRGKYRFLEDDDSSIEIREVTKFDCTKFGLIIEE